MSRQWEEQLVEEWGINNPAIIYANLDVDNNENYLVYPCQYPPRVDMEKKKAVYDQVHRRRILPDVAKEHPDWTRGLNPKNEDCPDGNMPPLYTPDFKRLKHEVSMSGGILYLTEGDKDLWTLFSIGIHHAAALFSAVISRDMKQSLPSFLKKLGVKTLRHIPDADKSGIESARKLAEVLHRTNIDYKALKIPFDDCKDVNDVWLSINRNKNRFYDIIGELEFIELPSQFRMDQARETTVYSDSLYREVEDRLGLSSQNFDRAGWSDNIPCPVANHQHDDANPAFGWNQRERFGYCFKCGTHYYITDVAKAVGVNVGDYIQSTTDDIFRDNKYDSPKGQQDSKEESLHTAGGELRIARSILSSGFSEHNPYAVLDDSDFLYSLDDAIENYSQRLEGGITSEYPPIPNPIPSKDLHRLGGAARVIPRPFIVALLGASGGFKTSMLTTMMLRLARDGYHGIVWSPEWSPEKNADRVVQQMGGIRMDEMSLLERWHWEQEMIKGGHLNEGDKSRFGVRPSEERIESSWETIKAARDGLRGEVVFLNQFGANILEVLQMLFEASKRMRERGNPPSYFIMDYAQLAIAPKSWSDGWDMQDTILYTKLATLQLGLVTFMSSQVNKSTSKQLWDDDKFFLDGDSGNWFRSDFFNLMITLNPRNTIVEIGGKNYKHLHLAVPKNSLGDKANTYESLISLYVNMETLAIMGNNKE